jgi:cytochrome b6-f complex iron-sulfur subunit
MERRDFVNNLGMVLALACAGGLAACSKNNADAPNPGGGGFSANLGSELTNIGGYG